MKINEIIKTNGIYVGCRLSTSSNNKLNKFILDNKIPDYAESKVEESIKTSPVTLPPT